jgi:large subunit ribosomal protein L5
MVDEKTVKEKTVTKEQIKKVSAKKSVTKKVDIKTTAKTTAKDISVEKNAKTDSKVQDKKIETAKKTATKQESKSEKYQPSYRQFYDSKIIPSLMKKFNYSSVMEVPKLKKITLNMGIGDAKLNPKALESAVKELTVIAGQKAVITLAKKDVSNFKIRRGFPVGCTVNIRGKRMYEFFERLNSIALPRTRDFTGLSFKSFDKRGNYNFGVKEQIVFTEIDYDKINAIRGLDIAITTSAKTDEEAYALLKEFGFPLREKPVKKNESAEAA